MSLLKTIGLAPILWCSACAVTSGAPYKRNFCDDVGKGVAAFYQEAGFVGGALHPLLKINGIDIGPIPKGGFIAVQLPEGEHQFEVVDNKNDLAAWSKSEDLKAKFSIREGEDKLFKFYVRNWSPAIPIPVGAALIPAGGSRQSAAVDIPYEQVSETVDKLKGRLYVLRGSAIELDTETCEEKQLTPERVDDQC